MKVAIIGGGAAGYFTAINCLELNHKHQVTIFEKSSNPLQKVKISGGGRCNVSHACFIPNELVKFYPRGKRELLGPFTRFMTGDTMEWFENHGVPLKIEDDNRIFPQSNSSQTIIDLFTNKARDLGVKTKLNTAIIHISKTEKGFIVTDKNKKTYTFDSVVFAPGSSKVALDLAHKMGLEITETVPSLFTFRTPNSIFNELSGVTLDKVSVKIEGLPGSQSGPLLFTHRGLSGPAILKTSAYKALELSEKKYEFSIYIDFLPKHSLEEVLEEIETTKKKLKGLEVDLPKRLIAKIIEYCGFSTDSFANSLSAKSQKELALAFKSLKIKVNGKDTFKEEFVTAGGIDLKEIDFKSFEAKKIPNFFIAGEILNIDAVTGGFNFQAAWTGAFHIATALSLRE